MKQQIIALGGGGFSIEPENLALDRFILNQSGKEQPTVCFLPTASGDAAEYLVRFYGTFTRLACRPTHLSLFSPPQTPLADFIRAQDVIYVGGGNTKSMLALWREWQLDDLLRQALTAGTVLAGISAGAICWFEQGLTDSLPGRLSPLTCLGYLPGSMAPHYDGEPERRPAYQGFIAGGEVKPGYAVDDGAALHFVDGVLKEVVSSRPQARAYYVRRAGNQATEEPLPTRQLD